MNSLRIEELEKDLKFYEMALKNAKDNFQKAIFEFEIACTKKDLKNLKLERKRKK